ncbi:ABC transporter permease [Ornithinimicrobium sediminis]|uniref:ABC transporter permease n=1 Tax=Ornithinimicrobium sediminis TaxID=2904603 RepID=UPI001E2C96B4|nr:ABC transporter permease [Ornithinimicrobium sediminis]MCE0487971.1 ABC transporter permease [Ornithinimicrobium sediminis]
MRQLLTMTASDLRQRVRDRSVLIFALVVPLALMYVFNLVFGGMTEIELEPVTVAVAAPAEDELAPVLEDVLTQVDGLDVTLQEVPADQVRSVVDAGEAGVGVVVPEGFGAAVMQGEAVTVQVIEGDGTGLEAGVVISVLDGVLAQLTAATVTATAAAGSGLPPEQLAEIAQASLASGPPLEVTEGQAADEQLGPAAGLVAGQTGLFLLFTVGFGVLGLVTEREQGTLARLHAMPMRPGLIIAAKGLVSFVLGVVATSVLLTVGGLLFGVSFGSPVAVAVLVVCVVAAATSLMFIIARVARTAEQAGIAQSIVALVLGIAGGAFFPITGTGALAQVLDLNPIAAFTRGLGITAGGGGVADLGVPVAIMLGFGVVMVLVSRLVPDRGAAL